MAKRRIENGITWTNERRALRDLAPWEHNPRYIKDAQAERLLESFNEFGQVLPICIGPSGQIYDGHQRRNVIGAADDYGLDYEIDVRVASRELTERERQKLTVYLHKGATGDWDWEELANSFEFDDLILWGFRPYELGVEGEGNDVDAEWQGMPEFENNDAMGAILTLKVHFATQDDIDDFSRLIGQDINTKTKFIWHPKQVHMDLKKYRVQDES